MGAGSDACCFHCDALAGLSRYHQEYKIVGNRSLVYKIVALVAGVRYIAKPTISEADGRSKFARNEVGRRCKSYEAALYRTASKSRRDMLCPVVCVSRCGQSWYGGRQRNSSIQMRRVHGLIADEIPAMAAVNVTALATRVVARARPLIAVSGIGPGCVCAGISRGARPISVAMLAAVAMAGATDVNRRRPRAHHSRPTAGTSRGKINARPGRWTEARAGTRGGGTGSCEGWGPCRRHRRRSGGRHRRRRRRKLRKCNRWGERTRRDRHSDSKG